MSLKIKPNRKSGRAAQRSQQASAALIQAKLNDAVALHQQGQFEQAIMLYSDILKIEPKHFDAIHLLGVVADQTKNHALGAELIAQAIAINPNNADAHFNRGNALKDLNQVDEAIASYDKAIALNPRYTKAYGNRGIAQQKLGRLAAAVASYDKAISLSAGSADVHLYLNRGHALQELRQFDAAVASYDKAIGVKPDYVVVYIDRGNALNGLKQFDAAVADYDKAIGLDPNNANAYYNRGNALAELRKLNAAVASYDRAIALNPGFAEAYSNRGVVLKELRQLDAAIASYDKAIALTDDLAQSYNNRGGLFKERKRHIEAFADFDRAYSLDPNLTGAEGSRLHSKMYLCDWSDFEDDRRRLEAAVDSKKANVAPFAFMSISHSAGAQLNCARTWASKNFPVSNDPVWRGEIYKHDKIRIGYVSSDYREHPIAYLTAGVFDAHDKAQFELIAISTGPSDNSGIRARLEGAFDKFIDAGALGANEIAKRIKEEEIDILVDLNGFTEGARPDIFARRPAPIQMNYLSGTMGASYIDYIIGDPVIIPESHRGFYQEKIAYLPHTYLPNDYKGQVLPDRPLNRSDFGLPENGFVFCAFNNSFKLNPRLFQKWMAILRAVEGSVLWLTFQNDDASGNLRREASAARVDPDRLVFAERVPSYHDHLSRHRLADLFLDAIPFNAHTTACDALWAGLPVLTQIGEAFSARVAASLLTAIDLPELVTQSPDEFENLAIELANDAGKLNAIKEKLLKNLLTKPLFNTQLYTRHLESAYKTMYERYQGGLSPEYIFVRE